MLTLFQRRRFRPRFAALGALLALSVIWIGALQFAPATHAEIHDDAQEADHHCVVEVFSEGVLVGDLTVGVSTPSTSLHREAYAPTRVIQLSPPARLRPPGRAPPLS